MLDMANEQKDYHVDAYSQFSAWLSSQAFWLQDAAWRMYNGQKIESEQIQAYADMCVAQVQKKTPTYNHLSDKDIVPSARQTKMSVLELSNIVGVNALAKEAKLSFQENGLTVVYGLNGAGKSGFMRIFKQLSGSPYEEPIQTNVFKKSEDRALSCKFIIKKNEIQSEVICDLFGKNKGTPLSQCDVFDTRISNAYISRTNHVSYEPFVFTVLSDLAKISSSVLEQLVYRISGISNASIDIPSEIVLSEKTKWIENINADTIFPDEYSSWNEETQQSFIALSELLDTKNVTQKLNLAQSNLRTIAPILDDLSKAKAARDNDLFVDTYSKCVSAKTKLETAKKLFSNSVDKQDQISVTLSQWKSLWSTAKQYYEAVLYEKTGHHFAEDGSICPLCHQVITGDVYDRYANVNEYINGSCSDEYAKAYQEFNNCCIKIVNREYSSKQINQLLTDVLPNEIVSELSLIYESFISLKEVKDTEEYYSLIKALNLDNAIKVLSENKASLEHTIESLKHALVSEEREKIQRQYDALMCHKWIYENRRNLLQAISNKKQIKELENAKQYLTTNKITIESNALAQALITDAYIDRFTKELRRLAPGIKVKLEKASSSKGNSPYKVILDSETAKKCKPEDILSEGEQRIVALAAFFADATGRDELTPIIIDDPISSLDLNYEVSATKRIAEIAKDRQVIVFTHRISLLAGINESCDQIGVQLKENYIRGTSRGKGISDFDDIYRGKLSVQLSGLLNKIDETKKKDVDSSEYLDSLGKICQQFRICVERSVEDVLLLGMVHRFDRRIMTNNKVNKLTQITTEDCKIIDEMMTKYSFTEHSQPIDSPPTNISIDDLSEDIATFANWIKLYNKRMR